MELNVNGFSRCPRAHVAPLAIGDMTVSDSVKRCVKCVQDRLQPYLSVIQD